MDPEGRRYPPNVTLERKHSNKTFAQTTLSLRRYNADTTTAAGPNIKINRSRLGNS